MIRRPGPIVETRSATQLTTFVVYVEDKPGVLNRVASLFRRRAFNIESLTVGHTETPGVSRMTIVVDTDEDGARTDRGASLQARQRAAGRQRHVDAGGVPRPRADQGARPRPRRAPHIMQLVDVFRARIVDVAPDSLMIEVTGTEDKIDSLLEVLRPYGVARDACAPAAWRWRAATAPDAARRAAASAALRRRPMPRIPREHRSDDRVQLTA